MNPILKLKIEEVAGKLYDVKELIRTAPGGNAMTKESYIYLQLLIAEERELSSELAELQVNGLKKKDQE